MNVIIRVPQMLFRATRRFFPAAIVTLLAIGPVSDCIGGESKGWIGITLAVDTGSIFIPTLNFVLVTDVVPRSPASKEGLLKGDRVETVDGIVIHGAAADEMKIHLGKKAGETLTLGIRHADGTSINATMVARGRPWRPAEQWNATYPNRTRVSASAQSRENAPHVRTCSAITRLHRFARRVPIDVGSRSSRFDVLKIFRSDRDSK